ncbi:hypothetical protein J2Z22_004860 [Paenibacillus forsythiae]|uniref:Anti-bacteriophage protein A/HamA C-terminal domain-containing protein n=1 Tax=Paenibacillus forsythiae TaxID=365616 RepID=A0ABU3HEL4_9BACL|nr:hypothetical protein [Paenibacillus forsythiae]MDT3429259.1 hypothetical protein [Paenibacillus forsythiae]
MNTETIGERIIKENYMETTVYRNQVNEERFIKSFLIDVKNSLIKWDELIRNNYMDSMYKDNFYKEYGKGLDTWSVTEPILKFLIYIELLKKYKIRPEDHAYNDNKMLDFALYTELTDHCYISEIGIELKWAVFTKKGLLNQRSLQTLINDFVKMKELKNQYKYFIQHSITDQKVIVNQDILNKQILNDVDGRLMRKYIPRVISIESFEVWGSNEEIKKNFNLCLWAIQRR